MSAGFASPPAVACPVQGCRAAGIAHHSARGWNAGPCERHWNGDRIIRLGRDAIAARVESAANGGAR